jgi:hypothetical protein
MRDCDPADPHAVQGRQLLQVMPRDPARAHEPQGHRLRHTHCLLPPALSPHRSPAAAGNPRHWSVVVHGSTSLAHREDRWRSQSSTGDAQCDSAHERDVIQRDDFAG